MCSVSLIPLLPGAARSPMEEGPVSAAASRCVWSQSHIVTVPYLQRRQVSQHDAMRRKPQKYLHTHLCTHTTQAKKHTKTHSLTQTQHQRTTKHSVVGPTGTRRLNWCFFFSKLLFSWRSIVTKLCCHRHRRALTHTLSLISPQNLFKIEGRASDLRIASLAIRKEITG